MTGYRCDAAPNLQSVTTAFRHHCVEHGCEQIFKERSRIYCHHHPSISGYVPGQEELGDEQGFNAHYWQFRTDSNGQMVGSDGHTATVTLASSLNRG